MKVAGSQSETKETRCGSSQCPGAVMCILYGPSPPPETCWHRRGESRRRLQIGRLRYDGHWILPIEQSWDDGQTWEEMDEVKSVSAEGAVTAANEVLKAATKAQTPWCSIPQ